MSLSLAGQDRVCPQSQPALEGSASVPEMAQIYLTQQKIMKAQILLFFPWKYWVWELFAFLFHFVFFQLHVFMFICLIIINYLRDYSIHYWHLRTDFLLQPFTHKSYLQKIAYITYLNLFIIQTRFPPGLELMYEHLVPLWLWVVSLQTPTLETHFFL